MLPPLPILPWVAAIDLLGIAVFAASGALAAANKGQTLVTFAFFALVTGVGGGTVRDLLIGAPVFWVQDWRVPAVCLSMALLVWITPKRIWREKALDWFDAFGLAAYAVFGAAKSLEFGVPPLPAVMMGVITACVGGVIRDVLAGEPSILLRPEIYVTAAAVAFVDPILRPRALVHAPSGVSRNLRHCTMRSGSGTGRCKSWEAPSATKQP